MNVEWVRVEREGGKRAGRKGEHLNQGVDEPFRSQTSFLNHVSKQGMRMSFLLRKEQRAIAPRIMKSLGTPLLVGQSIYTASLSLKE